MVEVNASDDRTPEAFSTQLQAATQMKAVMGKDPRPNCLVLDEIDGAPAVSYYSVNIQRPLHHVDLLSLHERLHTTVSFLCTRPPLKHLSSLFWGKMLAKAGGKRKQQARVY